MASGGVEAGYRERPGGADTLRALMNVPLAVPNLSGRESEYVQECIRTTFVSSAGPFVGRFEAGVAEASGTASSAAVCSGTVALHVALEQVGVGRDDLVIVPTLTFIASANAVKHAGADPWFVDSARDWTIDVDLVRDIIATETDPHPRGRLHRGTGRVLRAIMPVMTMGATPDLDGIVAIAHEFGLATVLDAAAAIGGSGQGGQPLGRTGIDAICYSFNGNKTITCGGGGAVAAADDDLVRRIRHVTSTGRPGVDYDHDVVAYNFRMTNVEAAIGVAQLEQLGGFLQRKREVSERYRALADRLPLLEPFPVPASGQSTNWFSGVVYAGDDPGWPGDFRAHMASRDIDVRPFWKPIHLQRPYADCVATPAPVAERAWERIIPLPCSTGITDDELDHVVDAVERFVLDASASRRPSAPATT